MNVKQFLQWGGIILVVVGILGFFLIGPTAERSIFGPAWWFSNGENWAHLVIGIVALIAAYAAPANVQKGLVWVVGIVALLVGIWGFFLGADAPNFYGANLENPADNILHLVIGIWAIWAAYKTRGAVSAAAGPMM